MAATMDFDPSELDALPREELILRARSRGVERAELLTRIELRDEIVRRSEPDLERQRRTRGWLGVARDLLASVVESGLNLPDAAAAIRGDFKSDAEFQGPPPVATVTLAEIYAAQGHGDKAVHMLDRVLRSEPEHQSALALRARLVEEQRTGPSRRRRAENEPASASPSSPPPALAPSAVEADAAGVESAVLAPPPGLETAAEKAPVEAPLIETAAVAAAASQAMEPAASSVAELVVAEPVVAEPVVAEPVVAEPVVAEPVVAEPEVASPSAARIVLLRSASRAFVYWSVNALAPALRLRSVTVCPQALEPAVEEHDQPLSVATGGFWLSRLEPDAEVRVALGEVSAEGFVPWAVAEVFSPEGEVSYETPGLRADEKFLASARAAAG